MATQTPKLSICIPTYNRARYLNKALTRLFAEQNFDFPFEVVISDNASTDDTGRIISKFAKQHPEVRSIRQRRNVTGEENMLSVLRAGRGEYIVYLADDDLLLTDVVAEVVAYFDSHPNVAVCHSSWELWDDYKKESRGIFYEIERETVFSKATALDMCNLIVDKHIFPEIFIHRAEALHKLLFHPRTIYWAFWNIVNVLHYGDVAFLPKPFYRSVLQHWEGETRQQEGVKHATTSWDTYRGGIEYMIYRAFTYAGHPTIPPDQRQVAREMVDRFVDARLNVAIHMLVREGQFLRAYELFLRQVATGAFDQKHMAKLQEMLLGRAAADAFVRTYQSMTRVQKVGLYGVDRPDEVRQILSQLDPTVQIQELDRLDLEALQHKDRYMVLAGAEPSRQTLIEAGFPAGHVWSEDDLVREYVV